MMNIEFKAHNPTQEQIRKDIEKLIRERIPGNWFHLLKNADSSTISTLFQKMKDSFIQCEDFLNNTKLSITFCFCVLEKSWACMKHLDYNPKEANYQKYIDTFFNLNYCVKSGKIEVEQAHSWSILDKL